MRPAYCLQQCPSGCSLAWAAGLSREVWHAGVPCAPARQGRILWRAALCGSPFCCLRGDPLPFLCVWFGYVFVYGERRIWVCMLENVCRSAGGSLGGENAKAGNNNFSGEAPPGPGPNPRRPVLGSRSSPSDADCLGAHTLAAPGTWARRQTRRHRRRRPLEIVHREAPLLLLVYLYCTVRHGTRLHGTASPPTESGSKEVATSIRPANCLDGPSLHHRLPPTLARPRNRDLLAHVAPDMPSPYP